MTKFSQGQEVVCIDAEMAVGGLQQGQQYVIDRQTYAGYVWVVGCIAPYLPGRFSPL